MKFFGHSWCRRTLLLTTFLFAASLSGCDCASAPKPNPPQSGNASNTPDFTKRTQPVAEKSTDANAPGTAPAGDAAMPFSIELQAPFTFDNVPALHSYSSAQADVDGVQWLFIGGRVGGLHGFDAPTPASPTNSFPRDAANDRAWVIDIAKKQVWSMRLTELIPAAAIEQCDFLPSGGQPLHHGRIWVLSAGRDYGASSDVWNADGDPCRRDDQRSEGAATGGGCGRDTDRRSDVQNHWR